LYTTDTLEIWTFYFRGPLSIIIAVFNGSDWQNAAFVSEKAIEMNKMVAGVNKLVLTNIPTTKMLKTAIMIDNGPLK
jgi:hypothetical protein